MCPFHFYCPFLCAFSGVSKVTGRPPRVIYIIPSGQNPTGAIMSVERKQDIYEVRVWWC